MENKNILITSGGVETALNIIKALRLSNVFNCRIITSDMDPDSFGQYFSDQNYLTSSASSKKFINEISEIITKEDIDFIFPCHSTEINFFSKNEVYFKERGAGMIVPSESVESVCSNKKLFIDFLSKNNFPFPKTYKTFKEVKDYPVFIRPFSGSSSKGASIINSTDEIPDSYLSIEANLIIQDFINATEITVDAYRSNSGIYSISRIRKKVKDGKSVMAEVIFKKDIDVLVIDLLNKINFYGPCNIQLFYKNNDIKIIELNPRMSAGGLPLSVRAGLNIPEIMLKDYFNYKLDVSLTNQNIKMIRFLDEKFF